MHSPSAGNLEGKAIIVIGAGGGIGQVTAQVLAGNGVRVVVSDIVAH